VTIVEFGDFECPACRVFAVKVVPAILRHFPAQVAILFRNWPLPQHRFAYLAARAAECAGEQGKFEPLHDLLYSKQDSIGLKSFASFARESGVGDTVAFQACLVRAAPVPAIEADVAEAHRIHSPGTPTIVVNGLMVQGAADSTTMIKLIGGMLNRH
jgi:protein-disulfide isomerase